MPAAVKQFTTPVACPAGGDSRLALKPVRSVRTRARFADVRVLTAQSMPYVRVAQVYRSADVRRPEREVQVLVVEPTRILVRNLSGTEGVAWIARRRFRENTRGFAFVRNSPLRSVHAFLVGVRLANLFEVPMTAVEVRVGDALVALLGFAGTHDYLDDLDAEEDRDALLMLYPGRDLRALLADAVLFMNGRVINEDEGARLLSPYQTHRLGENMTKRMR